MLEEDLPDLLPELRPYQRRAAHWMVQREKGSPQSMPDSGESHSTSPLCLPVGFLSTASKMFYNPFRYKFLRCSWILIIEEENKRMYFLVNLACIILLVNPQNCLSACNMLANMLILTSSAEMCHCTQSILQLISLGVFLLVILRLYSLYFVLEIFILCVFLFCNVL